MSIPGPPETDEATFRHFVDTIHALEMELLKMEYRALTAELWIRLDSMK